MTVVLAKGMESSFVWTALACSFILFFVSPINATINRLTLNATGAYQAVVGSEATLNCTVAYSQGDIVLLDWIFPNESLKKLAKESEHIPAGAYGYRTTFAKSLTIHNVTVAFEGEYTCLAHDRINNKNVNTSYYLFVNTQEFPYMHLSHPERPVWRTVDAGERDFEWVVLNVTSYPGRANVTWRFVRDKGIDGPDDERKNKRFEFDGRFVKVLIDEVVLADSGLYTIMATNFWDTRKVGLKLYVNDKPRIKMETNEDRKFYLPNQNYTLERSIYAYPRSQIEWYVKKCSLGYARCENEEFEPLPPMLYDTFGVGYCLTRTKLTINSNVSLLLSLRATNSHGRANITIRFPLTGEPSILNSGRLMLHNLAKVAAIFRIFI